MANLRAGLRPLAAAALAILLAATPPMPGEATAQHVIEADQIAIQTVIRDQIEAFRAGDHERAYSHAAPTIKGIFPTVERFIEMVQRGYMPLYRPAEYHFGRSLEADGEIHQEVIVTDESGKLWQAVYTLRRQDDGSWKVTGVKLNPHKGASA